VITLNATNFSGFATKEECFANSCAVWDDVTGCNANIGGFPLLPHVEILASRERARDVSDALTYVFGGYLYDSQGNQTRPVPGGAWNVTGNWPWAGFTWRGVVLQPGLLDETRIGMVGHSAGALTGVLLTSKAAYDGYLPTPGEDWDLTMYHDPRIGAVMLYGMPTGPGVSEGMRVWMPLTVPSMIVGGVYDASTPYADDQPNMWGCLPPNDVSGTGLMDPICSHTGLYAAAQFDAPGFESQGLVTIPNDPPRFLTRLDTAGHFSILDDEIFGLYFNCPANPSLPCSCAPADLAFLGSSECTQLAGDKAVAEAQFLAEADSFLGAFVAKNPSAWRAVAGDLTDAGSGAVVGHLFADWDQDAAVCGSAGKFYQGDGILDSVDPDPLVCQ
jgi:hypothetical protein